MSRYGFAGAVALAAMLAAASAQAATTTFRALARCVNDCDNVNMLAGDPVYGTLEISTLGFAPGGAIARGDLFDFSFEFGPDRINLDSSPGYSFSGQWGADANTIASISIVAASGVDLDDLAPLLVSQANGRQQLSALGWCADEICSGFAAPNPATIGPLAFEAIGDPAPVPAPPAILMLLSGALSLAGARGRRAELSAGAGERRGLPSVARRSLARAG